jgi:tRNA modification GTPase
MAQSQVILQLLDASSISKTNSVELINAVQVTKDNHPDTECLLVLNKIDIANASEVAALLSNLQSLELSAKTGAGVEALKSKLLSLVQTGKLRNNDTIITNTRHYDALGEALKSIQNVQTGLDAGLSGDLMAIDIREALHHFGRITGEISTDDLLGNIFANFCIGK